MVHAFDQDQGINDAILYTITRGNLMINGTPSFFINESTGLITVNVPSLDREVHASYSLEVTVSLWYSYSCIMVLSLHQFIGKREYV